MLTNNLRTHIIVLSDDREIAVTQSQYQNIRNDVKLMSYNELITISDPDDKTKVLYEGKVGSIKEFREIKSQNMTGTGYHCDFGIFHTVHESCTCSEKYKVNPINFRLKLREMFPNVKYPKQVTAEMRNKVLAYF